MATTKTTYYFAKEVEEVSTDIEEGIDIAFHEDMFQFSMEQDIHINGSNSVYFS
jgi:hypothetical protein